MTSGFFEGKIGPSELCIQNIGVIINDMMVPMFLNKSNAV